MRCVTRLLLEYIDEFPLFKSEYNAIQEKLNAAQQELAQFTAKYNELQKSFETERTAWNNDKKVLEDTIVDLGTSEKYSASDRTSRENEVRQLEERAKVSSGLVSRASSKLSIYRRPRHVIRRKLCLMQNRSNLSPALSNNCQQSRQRPEIIKLLQKRLLLNSALQRAVGLCKKTLSIKRYRI
jgi:hypothetical protein